MSITLTWLRRPVDAVALLVLGAVQPRIRWPTASAAALEPAQEGVLRAGGEAAAREDRCRGSSEMCVTSSSNVVIRSAVELRAATVGLGLVARLRRAR